MQYLAAGTAGPVPTRVSRTMADRRSADEPRRNIDTTTRAIVILCLIIVLAIWTVTAFSLRSERQSLIDRSRSEARNLASAFAADAGNALDRLAASMAVIAQHISKSGHPPDVQTLSGIVPLLGDGRIEASIVGPDGRLISSGLDSGAPAIDPSEHHHRSP